MFRYNKRYTYSHNLKLAIILTTVAGIVNITGAMALDTLTTNVTGHFVFFSEELFSKNYKKAFIYLFYIIFFLFGAFVSSFLMEFVSRYKPSISYVLPILIEIGILLLISIHNILFPDQYLVFPVLIASTLLFTMGLQNALVTRITRAVVRSTHLTGLFTDLGIELSKLLFYREKFERDQMNKSIYLKMIIIGCFFLGGIIGGLVYCHFELKLLFIPVILLLLALWYDFLLFRYYNLKRKLRYNR